MSVCAELGYTESDLGSKLLPHELGRWVAFFQIRDEIINRAYGKRGNPNFSTTQATLPSDKAQLARSLAPKVSRSRPKKAKSKSKVSVITD